MKKDEIEIEHVVIKKIDEDNYIVNNLITNKYVRMGVREVNYFLLLKGREPEVLPEGAAELTGQQKAALKKKYEEWELLEPGKKQKTKKDLSNLVLMDFKPEGRIGGMLKLVMLFFSPLGLVLFLTSTVALITLLIFQQRALMQGAMQLRITVGNMVLLYLGSIGISLIHELCHAAACYKYSGKCGRMGIKLFYLFPAYFCDVSNSYLIKDKKRTFVVAASGLMWNHIAGTAILSLYILMYHNKMVFPVLLLLYISNFLNILFNLLPIAKFDGYWMLKALTGVDNLYDKCLSMFYMACFRRKQLKNTMFSWPHKCMAIFYGLLLYTFHWGLWILGIFGVYLTLQKYTSDWSCMAVIAVLIIIGVINCLRFTRKYYKQYQCVCQ